jgi:hypothetical protein
MILRYVLGIDIYQATSGVFLASTKPSGGL